MEERPRETKDESRIGFIPLVLSSIPINTENLNSQLPETHVTTMNIAILTPIQVEHCSILARLAHLSEELANGCRYLIGSFEGKHHSFRVVTQQVGSKNGTIALATEKIIRHCQPTVVILAGVAGGIKDVRIGDVVVGTKYYGYESGKEARKGFLTRPESGYYSRELLALAQSVASHKIWHDRVKKPTSANVVFGAIASGDKVVTNTRSATYHLLKQSYNDTTAIEMEAIGFGQAMLSYPAIRFLNVRGISDLLDRKSKSDNAGNQALAAENMSAFVFELLYHLDASNFKIIGSMDVKELAKQIISLVIPIIRIESSQDIDFEINDIEFEVARKLWEKVKWLPIEEYELLKQQPEDPFTQGAAYMGLKQILERKDGLCLELEKLVSVIKKEAPSGFNDFGTINLGSGKIIMIKNEISTTGDIHLNGVKIRL